MQLVTFTLALITGWRATDGLHDWVDVAWFAEALSAVLVDAALLVALQRRGPRSLVVAQALSVPWHLYGTYLVVDGHLTSPEPFVVDAIVLGQIAAEILSLWLVASLFLHAKTRAYLAASPR